MFALKASRQLPGRRACHTTSSTAERWLPTELGYGSYFEVQLVTNIFIYILSNDGRS